MRLGSLVALGLVAACAAPQVSPPPDQQSVAYRQASVSQLCSSYQYGANPLETLMIEAELAVRGVKQCEGSNIGIQTAASVGMSRYDRTSVIAPSQDYDCSDFSNGAVAQRFFLASGGPNNDPHRLDADGDGLACEWGTEVRRLATYRPPAPRISTPRRSSGSTCYTGPRGGTYTITASGNKNYDGC
jgi:hypothetical protein